MGILLCFVTFVAALVQSPITPQQTVDELLAADRAFSAAARSKTNVIEALTPMFVPDVIMPQPGGKFARGIDEVVAALKLNPANATAKAEWLPIRGGISADGTHGFTFGYMTVRRADGTSVPAKYMSYWIRTTAGWRVAAYKRAGRPEGDVPTELMPASLPARMVTAKAGVTATVEAEVAAAEKAFSDDAQKIGIGPAFTKHGAPDAANMGPTAAYVVGNEKIGAGIGGGSTETTSPVRWAADEKVIAAPSGDLGVSIGLIRSNGPGPDGATPPPQAFFTIWRKVNGVWKYVAE
jgi:ketosteroid isomerase-like protein